jgi:ubiquinol-cytochrome c reductase cytochrome c1 subunit
MKTCRYPSELYVAIFVAMMVYLFPLAVPTAHAEIPKSDYKFSEAAAKRGRDLYTSLCRNCHSLKYFGYQATISAEAALSAFGDAPPDLNLMAKARGKGSAGAVYIYALLTSYTDTPEKNSIFPDIAMPPPFSRNDPELTQKANDVSAFLAYAAEPSEGERRGLGRYVLGYMAILVVLLYLLNRRVWKGIRKSTLKK